MSDISQIALNGVTYNVKDSTARTEAAKKVTASGGDISNTKVAAYTASSASYPVPAAGETPKVFMGKIKKFFEDFISFKDSIVTKAMILNQILNDSTKAASAATVYSVNKRVDDVNSDLANKANNTDLAILDSQKSNKDLILTDSGSIYDLPSGGYYCTAKVFGLPSAYYSVVTVSAWGNEKMVKVEPANSTVIYKKFYVGNAWGDWIHS